MNQTDKRFLPGLDPPANGLTRLRMRRDRGIGKVPSRLWQPALAGGMLAVLLLLFLPAQKEPFQALDRLLGTRVRHHGVVMTDANHVATELPGNEKNDVHLFWISDMTPIRRRDQ